MIKPELEWHVHSRILTSRSSSAPRQVVNSVFRTPDELNNTVESSGGVVGILGS